MRKIAVVVMAAFMMSAALPVMAADMKKGEMSQEEKDQCLLESKRCATQVDTLQKRIDKLDQEIKKGTRVYSPEELKKLNQKLKEANDILNVLEHP